MNNSPDISFRIPSQDILLNIKYKIQIAIKRV